VARAFDQVHREAVRLAANEAALRGNVNAMFVNLSRRSQSLVQRQIRVITRLEQGEQDSERLATLFQLDHLATRMRRNSENLLVLAGEELSRRWSRPVALVDVLRAAASEIEQYERVTLNAQPGISVRREPVSDLVHLTAELVENATSFSPAGTPVTIAAHTLNTGGVLIEITDLGVGMGAEDLAHVNWRLDNPPTVDVAVSRRMGLFVVGRLAARHGIRVRLRPGPSGGMVALVWLPDQVITTEKTSSGPLRSVSVTGGSRGAGRLAAADTGESGHLTSPREPREPREFVRNGGIRRDSITPAPRPAPVHEGLEAADPGQHPLADDLMRGEHRPAIRPLRRIGGRLYPAGLAPGAGPQDAEPGLGGDDERSMDGGSDGGRAAAEERTPPGDVRVPHAGGIAGQERLPIYDAVESDWFRRGASAIGGVGQGGQGWSSPADDGWRAAEVVHAPTADGTTSVGLPKRVPRANLVPGTAGASAGGGPASDTPPASAPGRSAAENRDRFASLQRGIRMGRVAATGGNPGSEEGATS
jgi:hypothetical protein